MGPNSSPLQSEVFFDEGTLIHHTVLSENSQFSSSVEAVPRAPKPNSKQCEQRKRGARLSCPSATGTDHLSTSRFEFLSESPAQALKSCFRRSRRTSRGIAKQQALMLQQEGWTLEEHEAGTPVYNGRVPRGTTFRPGPLAEDLTSFEGFWEGLMQKTRLFRQQLTLGLLSEHAT